jgi:hypothetical protein
MTKTNRETKKKKTGRGGYRPGSGRKPELDNPQGIEVNLDEPSLVYYTGLGEGNVSEGIRRGRKILESLGIHEYEEEGKP